jgi:hypothetical protein
MGFLNTYYINVRLGRVKYELKKEHNINNTVNTYYINIRLGRVKYELKKEHNINNTEMYYSL